MAVVFLQNHSMKHWCQLAVYRTRQMLQCHLAIQTEAFQRTRIVIAASFVARISLDLRISRDIYEHTPANNLTVASTVNVPSAYPATCNVMYATFITRKDPSSVRCVNGASDNRPTLIVTWRNMKLMRLELASAWVTRLLRTKLNVKMHILTRFARSWGKWHIPETLTAICMHR